jgi:hypothetical protein
MKDALIVYKKQNAQNKKNDTSKHEQDTFRGTETGKGFDSIALYL